ncbi:hypothetical protein P7C73_g6027, partial [Tremellales sp. Uapishka_1]
MSSINLPSSSKRPATSSPNTQNKRPRSSAPKQAAAMSVSGSVDDEGSEDEGGEIGEEALAKAARRDARTQRNRESAQRSRNQRKAHLVDLERRVVELEEENRRLRSGSAHTSPPPFRETSPAQSVMSLASELGIPAELVGGGVNLANVAPPPSGMNLDEDVKPFVPVSSTLPLPASGDALGMERLKVENTILRERVVSLEHLVKQVVALSPFGATPSASTTTTTTASHLPTPISTILTAVEPAPPTPTIDWDAFFSQPQPTGPASTFDQSISPTLSPPPFPITLSDTTVPSLDSSTLESNLARHPAAVATSSSEESLQRARQQLISNVGEQRLRTVARVVVALAKLRGWSNLSPSRTRKRACWPENRCLGRRRTGMRR